MLSWRRMAELATLPTIGLGMALALAPDRAAVAVRVWLLIVLGLASIMLLGVVRSAYRTGPSPFAASLRQPRVGAERPAALLRLEREVSMAVSSAFDVHYRLRPALVELAAGLLSSRRGIELETDPARARAVLGDDVWELVRPDRPQPTERDAAGIDPASLDRVVEALGLV